MRWWNELVAAVGDAVPLALLVLIMIVAAGIVAALWYWFPAWVPRRLPRFRRPRWRLRWPRLRWPRLRLRWPRWRWPRLRWPRLRWPWRRRRPADPETEPEPAEPAAGDELPDVPAEVLTSLADRLAAEGRYAEAVRERLRAMVRDLVDRGVIEHRPGWTVTELAAAAVAVRPAVDAPLGEAGRIFSDIWYGQRPADAGRDARMRTLGADLHATLTRNGGPLTRDGGMVGAGTGGDR
jgi:hypothetical protein